MSVDYAGYQRLLQYTIPEIEQSLTARDTMLHALGVGLGADPLDEKQLRFVYEKRLAALPTMAVILAAPHAWIRKSSEVSFRCVVAERSKVALNNGRAEIA